MQSLHDVIDGFRKAMADAGIQYHGELIADGKLHRFTPEGDKNKSNNGWYVLYGTDPGGGQFGNWKLGIDETWTAKNPKQLSQQDREEIARRIEESRKQRDEERELKQKEARENAAIIWEAATPVDSHPYTDRKGITPFCARVGAWNERTDKDVLILPIMSGKTLHSLQAIFPDGQKRFLPGGALKGNYMKLQKDGDSMETVVICEGYATGVSIYEATGYPVIVAFNANNLTPVAEKVRRLLPKSNIIIAADNDSWHDTGINPGIEEATKAGKEYNCRVTIPVFNSYPDDAKPTDFNDLHQYEGLDKVADIIMDRNQPVAIITESAPPAFIDQYPSHPQILWDQARDCNGQGKPYPIIRNVKKLLDHLGIEVRYNVIKKDVEILIPGQSYSVDNNTGASIAWLTSACIEAKMQTGNLLQFLLEIADKNQFNPVKTWIESKPWDGVDRLTFLTNSLASKDPELTGILLRKWMVGAVHSVYTPRGIENSCVLVLQGEQYAGKTAWFKSLMGDRFDDFGREGATLNPADKDSQIGVLSYWLVELGELDATFRRSDIAALKGFISKNIDELRKPYAVGVSKYPRRTVFMASVNPKHYLHDETGNRRFWTVECTSDLNPHHGIDMQQAWAQVRHMHLNNHSWKLTRSEMAMLNAHNESYRAPDPIEELILDCFDPCDTLPRTVRLSASRVLQEVGYKNIQPKDTKTAAQILRKHFGEPVGKTAGCDTYALPLKKE